MDVLVTTASWLFLLGVLMALSSALPAVSRRAPRMLFWGFLVAAASPFLAILGAVLAN